MIWIKSLRLKNFLIFRDVELEFHPGLNVIVGESGSGKSLILKALTLLANKPPSEYVGAWSDHAELSAVVEVKSKTAVTKIFEIRKIISKSRRTYSEQSDVSINLADHIVYERQMASIKLMNPKEQLTILDSFGSIDCSKLTELINQINQAKKRQADLQSDLVNLRLLSEEISKKSDLLTVCHNLLEAGYNDIEKLFEAARKFPDIRSAEKLDSLWGEFKRCLSGFRDHTEYAEISDSVSKIDDFIFSLLKRISQTEYLSSFLADQELFGRFRFFIQDLRKSSGIDCKMLSEVLEFCESIESRLSEISSEIEKIKKSVSELEAELNYEAKRISELRKAACSRMIVQIEEILRALDFDWFRLEGKFESKEIDETGQDVFELLATFNKGVPLKPLRSVASGGEFNRFLFALAYVVSQRELVEDTGQNSTLCDSNTKHLEPQRENSATHGRIFLFDEIDSGLSGSALASLGRLIKNMSKFEQVILVSHNRELQKVADRVITLQKRHLDSHTEATVISR